MKFVDIMQRYIINSCVVSICSKRDVLMPSSAINIIVSGFLHKYDGVLKNIVWLLSRWFFNVTKLVFDAFYVEILFKQKMFSLFIKC